MYSTGNPAQCYVGAWMGGSLGRMDTCIHLTESLCCSPKTITTLLIGYGEGNGTPLQYSCLENPRDRGAWWAAVYGVAQSWTRLKRLSIYPNTK